MKPSGLNNILAICCVEFFCLATITAAAQETGVFMKNPADSRIMSLAGAGVVSLDDVSVLDNAALDRKSVV